MPSSRVRTYHHGDARNALLLAATKLLEKNGGAALSLREVAEKAGLSRQAPYNHFADKQALLADLVRTGFERLGNAIAAAAEGIEKPLEQLERAADAYIAFAQNSPALFRLMFSRELVTKFHFPEAAASTAFGQLVKIVNGLARPGETADLSLAAWSIVHGYATLCLETNMEPSSKRMARARLFAAMIAGTGTSLPR